jgi:hypothetical protein
MLYREIMRPGGEAAAAIDDDAMGWRRLWKGGASGRSWDDADISLGDSCSFIDKRTANVSLTEVAMAAA